MFDLELADKVVTCQPVTADKNGLCQATPFLFAVDVTWIDFIILESLFLSLSKQEAKMT